MKKVIALMLISSLALLASCEAIDKTKVTATDTGTVETDTVEATTTETK
jgi:major membrane immunogen (membrane-anchored lipoprotein)